MPSRTTSGLLVASLSLLAVFSGTTTAHSWPQGTIRLAPNGTMVGNPGYDRAHVDRATASRDDDYLIPPNGRAGGAVILPTDKLVSPTKMQLNESSYTTKFPMLSVAPGDFVAIQYTENGHVSLADSVNPEKPINRGTVYLYGTTQNDLSNTNLMDVHLNWTADGKGGDGKGKLLATRNFDDGQCHEVAPASGDTEGIITYRSQFISKADSLICQSDLQIPTDLTVGETLTVIWVWDWASMSVHGVAVPPATYPSATPPTNSSEPYVVKPEIYTGVVDYKIVDPCDASLGAVKGPTCSSTNSNTTTSSSSNSKSKSTTANEAVVVIDFAASQPAISRGIHAQMLNPFLVRVPQAGFTDVTAATADPSHIPMAALIGVTSKLAFPLASQTLAGQEAQITGGGTGAVTVTLGGGAPSATATATGTGTGSGKGSQSRSGKGTSTAAATASGGGDDGRVTACVTQTVEVPKTMVTVTVTRKKHGTTTAASSAATTAAAAASSAAAAATTKTAGSPPTVTQFLSDDSHVLGRRVRGERARR